MEFLECPDGKCHRKKTEYPHSFCYSCGVEQAHAGEQQAKDRPNSAAVSEFAQAISDWAHNNLWPSTRMELRRFMETILGPGLHGKPPCPSGYETNEQEEGEKCQRCEKSYQYVWRAGTKLWRAVTGKGEDGLYCISCFDQMAIEKGCKILYWECNEGDWKNNPIPLDGESPNGTDRKDSI